MADRVREWQISCLDVSGKRRKVSVHVDRGNIMIMTPPGDAVVLSPLETGRLRAALRDAIVATTVN